MERGPEGREGQVGREGVAGREGVPGTEGATGETGAPGPKGETGEALPRSVRRAFIAVVLVAVLVVGILGHIVNENRRHTRAGKEAHDALCVIKANFQVREKRTEEFLRRHPEPRILGIERSEFERSLRDTRETLRALRNLRCVPPAEPTVTSTRP